MPRLRSGGAYEYDGIEIRIKSNKKSFYKAYVALIKRIVNEGEDQINTRFKSDDVATILDSLPVVSFDPPFSEDETRNILPTEKDTPKSELRPNPTPNQNLQPQKNDPNRNRVVLNIYKLNTGNAKLLALFNELKEIPFRYKNSIASALNFNKLQKYTSNVHQIQETAQNSLTSQAI